MHGFPNNNGKGKHTELPTGIWRDRSRGTARVWKRLTVHDGSVVKWKAAACEFLFVSFRISKETEQKFLINSWPK